MKLSTMSPVPWTVLSHDLQVTAKDPMTSHAVHRLSNFALSVTEKARVLEEIAQRITNPVVAERQDKPKRPGFHVKSVTVYVWSRGKEFRFDSASKAEGQGYSINTQTLNKIRSGGHHQTKTGNLYWCLDAPEIVQQWRLSGIMALPKLPSKGLRAGRKPIPCFSYIRNGSIEYHSLMKDALMRATGKTHGNIKSTISKGVGHFHFRNGSWVWRATVPTPDQVVMLMANPALGNE